MVAGQSSGKKSMATIAPIRTEDNKNKQDNRNSFSNKAKPWKESVAVRKSRMTAVHKSSRWKIRGSGGANGIVSLGGR